MVTGFSTGRIPGAAVVPGVWGAVFAAGASASGVEVQEARSYDATSLLDFDAIRDPSLDFHSKGCPCLEVDQRRIHADPNALRSTSASTRWRRFDCRRSIVAPDTACRRSPWRRS